ncbi:MAG: hypothetical protein A3C35_04975 [Omnitrophica bacterium RIFCSPHIGHO2_02_FULL_46_11]|nr:MAG: hypothetical protein A3C35_04975 [Omnitrophica bacterium RIFCSPHIGHO2_02_FULL_46_11]OGW87788.1 MAG: hypothetical protein A3A81_01665 [Omnitrophica bacterium RIFCSPLOWO2_01_FULL_45_10b]
MADKPEQEEKEKPKAEPSEKQESKAPASEKPAEPKAAAPAKEEKPKAQEKPEPAEKKGKKISRMTLAEVEVELKGVQEKMGGFESNFAQHLLARKKELSQPTARS